MDKIYVLDTNILLSDPNAIFTFEDNEVVIPAVVIEEIDSKKRLPDQVGRNAREVARILDGLRKLAPLHQGTVLPNGGRLRIELNHQAPNTEGFIWGQTNDNRILNVALNLTSEEQKSQKARKVVLVSKDAIIRIKANACNIETEDYRNEKLIGEPDVFTGISEFKVHPSVIDKFYMDKSLPAKVFGEKNNLCPNQFVILKDSLGTSQSAVAKYCGEKEVLEQLCNIKDVWGVHPRNVQQKMALDILINDDIPLVTLVGKAGTGKTLLSLASALFKTLDEKKYKKILVARPVIPFGKDIGFLPGHKEEKLRPWLQPFYDNLEYLFSCSKGQDIDDVLTGIKNIEFEALTYLRGRSIPNQFIIIDEAQNLTKHEVKTIISRVGEGTKLILMGDLQQIDHPYLDATNSGLTYVVERFKNQVLSAHVTLTKGERSALAQLAAELL